MRLYGPSNTRTEFIDRAPLRVVQGSKTVSGAASVVIATYTVPASRRALIETLQGALILTVAMAAGDVGELQAEVQPFGGAAVVIGYDRLAGAQAIGAAVRLAIGPVFLLATDVLTLRFIDGIVGGGSVTSAGGFEGVEYDP